MLRSLKAGEFDAVIERFKTGKKVIPQAAEEETVSAPPAVAEEDSPAADIVASSQAPEPVVVEEEEKPEPAPAPPPEPKQPASSAVEASLDEVILSYLMGDDE